MISSRSKHVLSLIVAMVLLLSACVPAPAANPTATPAPALTLTDDLQRPVTLAQPATRVVSLAPSNTEILFAIGAGAQVVGRDEFSDYPAQAKALPSVGGSMGKFDLEAIAALKPDLVLASQLNTPEQVKALESLNLTVYYLGNPVDFDGLYANLLTVGKLTGRDQDATALVDSLKARVKVVADKIAPISSVFTVFYELDGSTPDKPWTAGANTFVSMLIGMAGGVNIGDDLEGDYAQISQEALIASNPMVILLGDAAYGTTPEQVKARPGWDAIEAVKSDRIYTFDDNLVSRPGPRLVDGLETLARLLRPALFE